MKPTAHNTLIYGILVPLALAGGAHQGWKGIGATIVIGAAIHSLAKMKRNNEYAAEKQREAQIYRYNFHEQERRLNAMMGIEARDEVGI